MSYEITEEEKNRLKLNSSFVLPTSPSERGMKASGIKEMFWKPFGMLIDLINVAIGKLEKAEKDHDGSDSSHMDIRNAVTEACEMATETHNALQAAIGRKRVYYESALSPALGTVLDDVYGYVSGDMIVVGEVGVPDLIVFGAETEPILTATETITAEQIRSGTASVVTGGRYKIEGDKFGVVAIESGVNIPNIVVDTDFDAESSNAVANSTVTKKFDEVSGSINGVGNIAEDAILNANEAVSIAKGANQAVSFFDYDELMDRFNNSDETPVDKYKVGQNLYIQDVGVPDLWIVEVLDGHLYRTESSEEFLQEILANDPEGVHIGYYRVAMLETQKVDLTEYAKTDEIETKLDKVTSAGTLRVYGVGGDGEQTMFSVITSAANIGADRIPRYRPNTESVSAPANLSYVISTGTPKLGHHCVPKDYVDYYIELLRTSYSSLLERVKALEEKLKEQEV